MIPIPFIGGFYTLSSVNANAQRCLNWYPEFDMSGMGKYGIIANPTPGLKPFTFLTGGGSLRGLYTASNNRFFGVCGNTVSEIFSNGTSNVIGTLNSFDGIVRMSDNGLDLIIVDGVAQEGFTFIFTSNTYGQITDTNYPGGSHVSFINQRYLINKPNTQQYQWSDLADGTSWPGLNIASAESTPDNITSSIALGGELWTFGRQSFEVQFNVSGVPSAQAFAKIQGTPSDIGNVAPDSLARSNTNIFWLGSDDNGHGKVYMNQGYQSRAISTPAIDQVIQRYSKIDDAIGFCYQQLGHDFYVLNFPTAKATWVFDLSTGLWHERSFTNSNNQSFMNRGVVQDFFNGEVYVGDWADGNVYELDPDTYTDDGEKIHREITSPHIWNNLERSFYGCFQLDIESGVGLNEQSTTLTGLISTSVGNKFFNGVGTLFTTELSLNEEIRWTDDLGVNQRGNVASIASDISVILQNDSTSESINVEYSKVTFAGVDPQIILGISDDSGHTFHPDMEEGRSAGKTGEYKERLRWNRLGSSYDRIFRIRATDPVKWVILGAFIEAE